VGDIPADCSCRKAIRRTSIEKTRVDIWRYAIETGRILVTLDGDFGNLIRFSPVGTPGVIWLQPRPPTEARILSILSKWLLKLREVNLYGQLAIVGEDKLRIIFLELLCFPILQSLRRIGGKGCRIIDCICMLQAHWDQVQLGTIVLFRLVWIPPRSGFPARIDVADSRIQYSIARLFIDTIERATVTFIGAAHRVCI
jgi:predicted nuclease of predicted toxin-antitoxin system